MPRRRNQTAHKTKRLALCAVLCALGVVILGFGAVLEVMDITTTMLSSLLLLPVMLCYGNGYAFMTYAVTGVLSVILMPFSFAPWMYLGLAGYYPMVKAKFDKLPKLLSVLLKAILVLAALAVYFVAFYFLILQGAGSLTDAFALAFGEKDDPSWVGWLAVGLAYIAFFAYDLLIDRLLVLYRWRWQARVEKWMK